MHSRTNGDSPPLRATNVALLIVYQKVPQVGMNQAARAGTFDRSLVLHKSHWYPSQVARRRSDTTGSETCCHGRHSSSCHVFSDKNTTRCRSTYRQPLLQPTPIPACAPVDNAPFPAVGVGVDEVFVEGKEAEEDKVLGVEELDDVGIEEDEEAPVVVW